MNPLLRFNPHAAIGLKIRCSMPATFRIDEAYLVGAWCAAALWGVFSCLVAFTIFQVVMLRAKNEMNTSKYATTAAVLVLYGLSTTHVSLALRRLIVGFIIHQGPSTLIYFADIGVKLNVAKDMVYIHSMFIADSVVVWRCYIVWGKSKLIIALPVLLVMGTITSGYGAILQYFVPNPNPTIAAQFGLSMFAVSLTTNVVVTLMTVGRIWWLAYAVSRIVHRPLQPIYRTIILLLIESGLVITIAKLLEFVLFQIAPGEGIVGGMNALYIVFEIIPHINGIMPTLLIIVVNAKRGIENTQYTYDPNTPMSPRPAPKFAHPEMVFAHSSTLGSQSAPGDSELARFKGVYHASEDAEAQTESISVGNIVST